MYVLCTSRSPFVWGIPRLPRGFPAPPKPFPQMPRYGINAVSNAMMLLVILPLEEGHRIRADSYHAFVLSDGARLGSGD